MLPQGKPWTQALVVAGCPDGDWLWWKEDTKEETEEETKVETERTLGQRRTTPACPLTKGRKSQGQYGVQDLLHMTGNLDPAPFIDELARAVDQER